MTVEQFLNSWTRKHTTTVILCDYDNYDSMFDLVDKIRDGEENIGSLEEYTIGAIESEEE